VSEDGNTLARLQPVAAAASRQQLAWEGGDIVALTA
jgi:hypothetical protein